MCGNPVVTLVIRARDGDELAWAALVERYAPLIWSLCRRYRLDATDTADVGQTVWLLLVNQLGKIRDPAALPGWLATTTRRECQRVVNKAQVRHVARHEPDAENIPDGQAETIEQGLLAVERHAALRQAFTHLSPRDQQLIALLIEDPPVPGQAAPSPGHRRADPRRSPGGGMIVRVIRASGLPSLACRARIMPLVRSPMTGASSGLGSKVPNLVKRLRLRPASLVVIAGYG